MSLLLPWILTVGFWMFAVGEYGMWIHRFDYDWALAAAGMFVALLAGLGMALTCVLEDHATIRDEDED